MEIVRERLYDMVGSDQTLLIKKWSARKFFLMVGVLADIIDHSVSQMTQNGAAFTFEMMITKVILNAARSGAKVARVVKDSVEDPKLKEEDILNDWDMEDLLGVMKEIVDLNLTDMLKKKAVDMLKQALPQANLPQGSETPSANLN